jgi:hypothetical protein
METILLVRFDETTTDGSVGYADEIGNLDDLRPTAGSFNFGTVEGYCGRALYLSADEAIGLIAQDFDPGTTLAQRDVTVQMIISPWVDGQVVAGDTGTVIARGKGTGAAEYLSFGIQLRVIDAPSRLVEFRWIWQTAAGADKVQVGGHFTAPEVGTFTMLTATRRWISSTEVELRYYLGSQLLAEVFSIDGDIGGGTTGTTSIGMRWTGGAWGEHLGAYLDEIRVVDGVLCAEEIEATWSRIAIYQPEGYRQVVAALPPDWPFTLDPTSKNQQHMRLYGNALGFADAQAENMRANLMPDRAYGAVLERWERIAQESPRSNDTIEQRRARVLAHFADADGSSPPGVTEALDELCACAAEQLEILAFDATMREGFDTGVIEIERWRADPTAAWDVTGGEGRVQAAIAADVRWDGTAFRNARTLLTCLEARPIGMVLAAKVTLTALPDGGEAGVWLYNWVRGDALWLGVRRAGAVYSVGHQRYEAWVAVEAFTVDAVTSNTPHWLMIEQEPGSAFLGPGRANYTVSWSTTSGVAGFASTTTLQWVNDPAWGGLYLRSTIAALATAADVRFDDVALREPYGLRAFRWYVLRDPALPGSPDMGAANRVLRRLRQAHTYAAAITNRSLLCGDPTTPCGLGPMGAVGA